MSQTITATSGIATAEIVFDTSMLEGFVAAAWEAQVEAARAVIDEWGVEVTEWMKQNAPWQDRTEEERARLGVTTPHAREVLGVLTEFKEFAIEVILTGGVFYQKFLERNFRDALGQPRFAVLKPAFEKWVPELLSRLGAEIE